MNSLLEISVLQRIVLFLLIIYSIFLAVQLLMNHRQEKRSLLVILADCVCLVISYMEFNLLTLNLYMVIDGGTVSGWRLAWFQKPVWMYLTVQAVLAVLESLFYVRDRKWRKNHISLDSIKESMDSMPYGICCYYEGGMPRLINKVMHQIATDLFGETIQDGEGLWERLCRENTVGQAVRIQENQIPTWILGGEKVWSFTREKIPFENGFLYEILAADVTVEYGKTKELAEKNKRMRIITEKLKEYSKNVTRITVQKEVLEAKVRVHAELGQTLVATRRYLAAQDIDTKELLAMWNKNIQLLKKESISAAPDNYAVLEESACQLGVSLHLPDVLPMEEGIRGVVIEAVNECLTNAYKYAKSRELEVSAREDDGRWYISIENKGDVPEGKIREKGGLKNLRKKTEGRGGSMEILSSPWFCLKITMEKIK